LLSKNLMNESLIWSPFMGFPLYAYLSIGFPGFWEKSS
jgi:hypothetical protein